MLLLLINIHLHYPVKLFIKITRSMTNATDTKQVTLWHHPVATYNSTTNYIPRVDKVVCWATDIAYEHRHQCLQNALYNLSK